jgi:hypothetical protein
MRDGLRSIIGTMAIMSLLTPTGPDNKIGSGTRKTVPGHRIPTTCPKPKNKSASLKKLLRK